MERQRSKIGRKSTENRKKISDIKSTGKELKQTRFQGLLGIFEICLDVPKMKILDTFHKHLEMHFCIQFESFSN